MAIRKALMAGNWKMHTNAAEGCKLAVDVANTCERYDDREVLIAPPFTIMSDVAYALKESSIIIASQNVCWEEQGAFTGEISPAMVKDVGGTAVIVGHSERRQIFGETDEMVNKRVKGGLAFDLMVVFCIGETLEEREEGRTLAVLQEQVTKGLADVSAKDMAHVVVAYEPVWAIGTGETASKEQAQDVHAFVRGIIEKKYEKTVAEKIRILYGGSVLPINVDELMAQSDIDGALVGGASLDAESFGRIINFK